MTQDAQNALRRGKAICSVGRCPLWATRLSEQPDYLAAGQLQTLLVQHNILSPSLDLSTDWVTLDVLFCLLSDRCFFVCFFSPYKLVIVKLGLHCWVQFVSCELTVVNCTTRSFQFFCLPSDWEVHRKHSVLYDLQLPVQDHPGPAVSMHQVSLRSTVTGPDDPSAGARRPAREVWERKCFFSCAVKRKSELERTWRCCV